MDAGHVVAVGPVEDVLVPEVIDAVYRVATTVFQHPRTERPVLTFQPAAVCGSIGSARDLELPVAEAMPAFQPSAWASAVPE
jgi:hypothetical protein